MDATRIRVKLAALHRSQEWLARGVEVHPSLLSRYLRGLREPPKNLEGRLHAHLDRHLAAEQAANTAREEVLAS